MSVHTKEPWIVEAIDNNGEYGSGPDSRSGFQSFAICDAESRVLFDSLNRDVSISEIHEEAHEDEYGHVTAWDDLASRDARRIVACVNACAGITTERLQQIDKPILQHLFGADQHAASLVQQRDELLQELRAAHQIIRNALAVMITVQKADWGERNERDGVAGEGVTRANERESVIKRAGGGQ